MINCLFFHFLHIQVVLPFVVQSEVDAYLKAHLSKKSSSREGFFDDSLHGSSSGGSVPTDEAIYEQPKPSRRHSIIKERILQRKSLQLRDQQQAWQVYLVVIVL